MDLALRCAILSVSLASLFGCSGRTTLWLLDVSSLETSTAEAGSTLELSGHGFPAGHSGELLLHGTLRTAGETAKRVSLSLRAQAASSTRVTAFVDEKASRTVGGHATFEGRAQLRFAQDKGPWIAGEARDVRLEWLANEDVNDTRLRRDGQRTIESLGMDVIESATETGTVRIAGVHAGSIAAGARVVIGDRIEFANGLQVRSLADLAQPSAASSIRLVLRDAVDVERTLELDVPRSPGAMLEGYRYLLWVCPVLVAILLLGPWPAPVEFLRAGLRRLRRDRFALFRTVEGSRLKPRDVIITCTAVCAGISSFAVWSGSGLTLAAALGAYLVLLGFRAWKLAPSASLTLIEDTVERRAQSLVEKFRFVRAGALISVVLAGSGILGGSSSLAMLANEQGALPWGWSVVARPPTWLAAWIIASLVGRLHSAAPGQVFDVALDNLGRIILAVAIASVWFGGGNTGASGLWPAVELGLSSAVFALKLFGVLCLLAFLQPMAASTARRLGRASLVLLAANVVWAWVAPERSLEMRLGCAVFVSLLVASSLAVLEYLTQRRIADRAALG
jgi:hypothetical protein